jgi:hypothetical protein
LSLFCGLCYGFLSDDNAPGSHLARIRFHNVSDDGTFPINVKLPTRLRERARVMARQMRTTTTAIIVDALMEKVDAFEAKQRQEAELRRREDEEKRARRRGLALDLSPVQEQLAPTVDEPDADAGDQADAELYAEHATRLLPTLEMAPVDRRLAVAQAVKAIRDRHPLTSPPDHQILLRLEGEIARLRKQRADETPPQAAPAPPNREPTQEAEDSPSLLEQFFAPPAQRRIDPTRVQTFGASPMAARPDDDE